MNLAALAITLTAIWILAACLLAWHVAQLLREHLREMETREMAIISDSNICKYCHKQITLRTYAYNVKLWVTGNGAYPGDQKLCHQNLTETGSYQKHEPHKSAQAENHNQTESRETWNQ